MSNERLTEIETKLAFQENTINQLNEVVCRQQDEIDRLSALLKIIKDQMNLSSGIESGNDLKDDKPPHY